MKTDTFTFKEETGLDIFVYKWTPNANSPVTPAGGPVTPNTADLSKPDVGTNLQPEGPLGFQGAPPFGLPAGPPEASLLKSTVLTVTPAGGGDTQGEPPVARTGKPGNQIKGVLQIAHGMAEMAGRYERLAKKLTDSGYIVYANDHRGHGRTAKDADKVGDLGQDGFNAMVRNMNQLRGIIKKENPNLPFFMLGHSMGSFLMQRFICLHGDGLDGVILTGSNGREGFLLDIGCLVAKREIRKLGREGRSMRMSKLSFGGFNKRCKPAATLFDWLSRDAAEVEKYVKDPFCGGIFTAGFFYDFSNGLKDVRDKKKIAGIPKALPIYILSGTDDPVGKYGKGVKRLVATYRKVGIENLAYKLYPGARHEILNETNREEVMLDILEWLEQRIASGGSP
ncbi:MAG: alpha/beta hydrolase, partial [bacterium]|nr:alpha/beta hydrolase [bacterium]